MGQVLFEIIFHKELLFVFSFCLSVWYYLTVNSTTARSFVNRIARGSATSCYTFPSHVMKLLPQIAGKREEGCYTSRNLRIVNRSVAVNLINNITF